MSLQLHPYQRDAIAFLQAAPARQLIAIMGAGKTAIALHAIAELKQAGKLDKPVLVVAPLMVAETVWHAEAQQWPAAAGLVIERVIGTAKQRLRALARSADLYVINYDNLSWLTQVIIERDLHFSVLVADEASALKIPHPSGPRRSSGSAAAPNVAGR